MSRFGSLLLATLDVVSRNPLGSTTWNDFDNDGPDGRPNSGDDDGYVDFVTFLQPERDGACINSPNIWAHRFVIRAWNGGSPVDSIEAAGQRVYTSRVDATTVRFIVAGNLTAGTIALIHVPDTRRASSYTAVISQAAAPASYLQRDPALYAVTLTP